MPKKRSKKNKEVLEPIKFVSKYKYWIMGSALILFLVFFFAGAKIALYLNFLLGNDVILSVDVNNEFLNLEKGQSELIKFESQVTTNPFCKATCNYRFEDLSKNKVLEENSFILRSGFGEEKEYELTAERDGEGIELYRFHIECKGIKSFLCHTGEDVVTRSKLITLNYKLNQQDKNLKESLRTSLALTIEKLSDINGKQSILKNTIGKLEKNKVISEIGYNQLTSDIDRAVLELADIENFWIEQNYYLTEQKIKVVGVSNLEAEYEKLRLELTNLTARYNLFVDNLKNTRSILDNSLFNNSVETFESYLTRIMANSKLEEKQLALNNITNSVQLTNKTIQKQINKTCELIGCDLTGDLCADISNINTKIKALNYTINNITLTKLEECNTTANITNIRLTKITINDSYSPEQINVSFGEPIPDCCLFGKCENCCIEEKCTEENYPVVFLHGHAVNKDVSAEYSLEGFNKIQDKLEQEGYLNAGAVTLYTLMDTPEGIWGMINTPFAIRASYYFDIFEEPENYYVVQAKSENIDTYSIRLNDLIKTIKFKTGKDKVNIVAFSMGGLVARKYLQIFGTADTEKLILIGTPNHGVKGGIAEYCPLLGESLECRDMDAGSLFMNRLNRKELPDIPVYNIYGTGCQMNGGMGDGTVTVESAKLEGATNFIIQGECRSRLMPLHLDLRNLDLYPKVYDILKESLEE